MLLIVARFVDPELLAEPSINLMRLVFSPNGLHRFVENWEEVGPIMVSRIRREAEHEGKHDARALLDELLASPAVATHAVQAIGGATSERPRRC